MTALETLTLALGWTVTIIVGLFGLTVLYYIWTDKIDISKLISEPDGSGASLSRLQFLIFTFVIAISLFWVIMRHETFPEEISASIFALLGISGGSYVVSKGLQGKLDVKNGGSAPPKGGSDTSQ